MKLSDKIHKYLLRWCRSAAGDIVLPNMYVGSWEMDVFKLTKTGFIVEYEIKISRADFKNDFKKYRSEYDRNYNATNINKHSLMIEKKSKCNRFFFVAPEGLLTVEDIPSYAGLVEFCENGYLSIKKNAPLIHKNKANTLEFMSHLAKSCAFREMHWREKVRELKYKLKEVNKNQE